MEDAGLRCRIARYVLDPNVRLHRLTQGAAPLEDGSGFDGTTLRYQIELDIPKEHA